MKKVTYFFLAVIMLFSIAQAEQEQSEILFANIPWLSDETRTISLLNDAKMLRSIDACKFIPYNGQGIYLAEDENGFIWPMVYKVYDDVCISVSLSGYVKGRIGGYAIKDLNLTYAYNGEFQLISAKVELAGADYSSIKRKLETVYGIGEQHINEDGATSVAWKGASNSCILLFTENPNEYFELVYGRLDAKNLLDQCINNDPNEILGL